MTSTDLPLTDEWARDTVYNQIKINIRNEIEKDSPNIPEAEKITILDKVFQNALERDENKIESQIVEVSEIYKNAFKDDNGNTYLFAVDPYFYYRLTSQYIGYQEDGIINTKDEQKFVDQEVTLHVVLQALLYKILNLFSGNISLMGAVFFLPIIIYTLAIIPAFFIGKRLSGNLGGLITGTIVAIHHIPLVRTMGGFADTDAYNILFPLLIIWLLIETFEIEHQKKRLTLAATMGLAMGLFSFVWNGWWYIFDLIIGVFILYILYIAINSYINKINLKKNPTFRKTILISGIFLLSSFIFVTTFKGFDFFIGEHLYRFTKFFTMKDSVANLWPNVFVSISELTTINVKKMMKDIGGIIFFILSFMGICSLFIKKRKQSRNILYGLLLTAWLLVLFYVILTGVRFVFLIIPPLAITVGLAAEFLYEVLKKLLEKKLHLSKKVAICIILPIVIGIVFIPSNLIGTSYSIAKKQGPFMNDTWFETLTHIEQETSEDALITAWWDYGYWYESIAKRNVIFHGSTQNSPQAHWVGKLMITDDEKETIGIMKMLNCSKNITLSQLRNLSPEDRNNISKNIDSTIKNPVFSKLYQFTNGDTIKSIDIIHSITKLPKSDSEKILLEKGLTEDQTDMLLEYTHCNPTENYFITSQDLITKGGSWGQFGLWDFKKSKIWQHVKEMEKEKGVAYMQNEFNYSKKEAEDIFDEVKGLKEEKSGVNTWIAPRPVIQYKTLSLCVENNNMLECGNGFKFDINKGLPILQTAEGKKQPTKFAFINENKEFEVQSFDSNSVELGVALFSTPEGMQSVFMHPVQTKSIFTRLFFYEGQGLRHFEKFSDKTDLLGKRIIVWKIKWEGGEPIQIQTPDTP